MSRFFAPRSATPPAPRLPLPAAPILAEELLTRSLREVAATYGVTASAVCIRLRRAGMPRGKAKPRRSKIIEAPPAPAPVAAPAPGEVERFTWITEFGARVTLARFHVPRGASSQDRA